RRPLPGLSPTTIIPFPAPPITRRTTMPDLTTADALRAWARCDLALEAAVELLADAVGGRLLHGPWVCRDEHGLLWFDPDVAAAEGGYLSGGERRVLAIASS